MTTRKTPEPENSPEEQGAAGSQSKIIVPTAPLPEHISQNIENIIALQTRKEQLVPQHQRVVEVVSAFFSRPASLYSILLVICLWMLPNVLPQRFGAQQFDPPPFGWLQLWLGISSLLISTGVLITQNREEKLAEQRAQLSLQLNLISEQKIAKIIDLLEELRSDLPNVKDRHDPEAEVMTEAADPQAVIDALEQRIEEDLAELKQQKTSN